MLKEIAQAIKNQEYQKAAQLLQQLKEEKLENPWIQLYQANLDEFQGNLDQAEVNYIQVLQIGANSKIISQARRGIERIQQIKQEKKEKIQQQHQKQRLQELEKAKQNPEGQEIGVLILEPIDSEKKKEVEKQFAQIMEIDPYTARVTLPSLNWRIYRVKPIGELNYYTDALQAISIPCFCTSIKRINQIEVKEVKYFELKG